MSIVTEFSFTHLAEQREHDLAEAAERRRAALARIAEQPQRAERMTRRGIRTRIAAALHLHRAATAGRAPHATARG
jgi:hypothetical protein